MIEDIPLETAEERAQRIWRNNQLTRKITQPRNGEVKSLEIVAQEKTIEYEIRRRSIIKEVKEIFQKKRTDLLAYYTASIRAEKRKLMLEKLRRLERDNGK